MDASVSRFFEEEIITPETIKDYDANFDLALLIQRAYAVMLTRTGIIDRTSGKVILEGLSYVKENLKREDLKGEYEDMYYNIEKMLVGKTGVKIGGKLHTGRSRNDIGSTMNRMELRKSLFAIFDALLGLQNILIEKAEKHRDVIITGYTHMQPAQPITLGHYYTAILSALSRDFTRLKAAYENTNHCPYGSAAFAGASFPLDREMLAKLLGFDGVLENSLDCIASKDFLLEVEMAYTNMMVTISRVAQDQHFWSTDEFGLLNVGAQVAVCSSIMPQKKNPAAIEYTKAKASHVIGALMGCIASLKNIPFSNNLDIHEALWLYGEGANETRKTLGIMAENFRFSEVNEARALERAKNNFSTVTGLADHLVKKSGLSFEEAHQVVGSMVREVVENGSGMAGMDSALLKKMSKTVLEREIELSDADISFVLDPYNNVQAKETLGGPSSASVKKMIAQEKEKLAAEAAWIKSAKASIEKAYALLDDAEKTIRSE